MSDRKFYVNICENLPNGKIRFWLKIGLSGSNKKDIFIFDPKIKQEIHFSLHHDGNVHIRNGKKCEKFILFKNPWIETPDPSRLKQYFYFRPASDSYPILEQLPQTDKTINSCFSLFHESTQKHDIFPNMVFKILLGPLSATKYSPQHKDINGDPDIIISDNWKMAIIPMVIHPRQQHDNGTWIWFFNTREEVTDQELFSNHKFEIGPASLTNTFIISQSTFNNHEVSSVYYRL